MERIVRNICDIETGDRHALEHVIGQRLNENQVVIIQVQTMSEKTNDATDIRTKSDEAKALPAWCSVYDGLSDQEIEENEAVILDRDHWTRDSA